MLRTANLQNPEVVIIDLGIAQDATTTRTIIYGTPGYIPPEVWLSKNWVPLSDMFSLGVVIMQMIIGRTGIFTEGAKTYRQMEEIVGRRTPPFELLPPDLPSLRWCAQKLLLKNLSGRPTAATLLHEPWEMTEGIDFPNKRAEEMGLYGSSLAVTPEETEAGDAKETSLHCQSLVGRPGPQRSMKRRETPPAGVSVSVSAANPGVTMSPIMTPRQLQRRQTVAAFQFHRQPNSVTRPVVLPTVLPGSTILPGSGSVSVPRLQLPLSVGSIAVPLSAR